MKNKDNVAVIVQARMGSERVPGKMLKPFAGTTIMDICLEKLSNSKIIDNENVYVSVWEPELKQVTEKYNLNIFNRSRESAFSEGTPMTLIYEWWNKLDYEYCILVNACAPFLKISTIEDFYKYYIDSEADGLFGVIEKNNYFWNENSKLITKWPEGQAVMNTKFVGKTYEAAHCLYAGRLDKIGDGIWMGDFLKPGDINLFPMKEKEVLDIDYQWEFDMCELLFNGGMR
jgi:CMP-N-acetylneuraminic acid synthetase